jgi:hypothetical protein
MSVKGGLSGEVGISRIRERERRVYWGVSMIKVHYIYIIIMKPTKYFLKKGSKKERDYKSTIEEVKLVKIFVHI